MERALQVQNPDVAIPYWDTYQNQETDSVMFSEFLFGNNVGEVIIYYK